jgi:hypothetical protein
LRGKLRREIRKLVSVGKSPSRLKPLNLYETRVSLLGKLLNQRRFPYAPSPPACNKRRSALPEKRRQAIYKIFSTVEHKKLLSWKNM